MNKRDQIPQVVVNLHVRYYKPLKDGTMERLIPCHSWGLRRRRGGGNT